MRWYDWLMAAAGLWMSGGILFDSYHHFHEEIDTFFEPGHAVLYAGLLAAYVFTACAIAVNLRKGFALRNALPAGYEATSVGLAVVAAGGLLDMLKHQVWGFEQFFNALLSPTHLTIGAGMFLIMAGPVASALQPTGRPRALVAQLPMILSAASIMELLHWGLQFIFMSNAEHMNRPLVPTDFPHDTLTLLAIQDYKLGIGILAVIVQSLLLVAFAVFLARRVRLAFGAIAVLFVVGNAFIAAAFSNYPSQFIAVLLASLLAGLCADAFALRPSSEPRRWAWCAFTTPIVYWSVLLIVLALTMNGIWWTPDVIAGCILFAGCSGLFINAVSSSTVLGMSPDGTDAPPV
jgi:hypothetical protein